jgi:hypothetical protein
MKISNKLAIKNILGLVFLMTINPANAQDAPKSNGFAVTTDLVSSYMWRGIAEESSKGGSPNVQPTITYVNGCSTTGVWGSTAFSGAIKEVDFYETVALSPLFSVTLTDDNWFFNKNYFNYKNAQTDHIFEGTLTYTGEKSFPLTVSANTMFYGDDKKEDGKSNAFSTYVELDYPIASNVTAFLGSSLFDSPTVYYNSRFSVINLGVKVSKNVKISDSFTLPVYGIVGCNPQAEKAFFVAGITL